MIPFALLIETRTLPNTPERLWHMNQVTDATLNDLVERRPALSLVPFSISSLDRTTRAPPTLLN